MSLPGAIPEKENKVGYIDSCHIAKGFKSQTKMYCFVIICLTLAVGNEKPIKVTGSRISGKSHVWGSNIKE